MSGFGRRTFLASSAGVAAGAAAGAALPFGSTDGSDAAELPSGTAGGDLQHAGGPLRVTARTVNGLTDPIGIDPDGCFFAWTLRGPGRAAAQTGSRLVVRRTDPTRTGVVWDSGTLRSARQAFVAYAGPPLAADAAYEWTVQAQDAGRMGACLCAGAVHHGAPRRGLAGPLAAPGRRLVATRSRDLSAHRAHAIRRTVVRATAYVSAAHTYRLFVDGAPVDAWPSFSYPDEQYMRSVDVTRAIVGGRRSAIGVLHRWYGPGQGRPASSPGLLFQLSVWYRDGRHAVFGSDGTWRELPAEWLPSPQRNGDVGDFVEWVDGQAQPQGWSNPGYDDGAWSAVTVLGPAGSAPFSRMYAQRTTVRETPVHPVRLHAVAGGAIVADFGAVYAARPHVSFGRGVPGSTVTIRAGYLLDPDGQVSTLHGTQGTNLTSTYIMRAGSQAFEAFTYFGFRYLQVANAGQPVSAGDIVALTRHAAMPDVPTATFTSDNRMLNAVWRLCARSCLYCCNEQFVDTPTREKGPFLWDASNESEGVMRAYGDQNMSWQALRDIARGQARYWPGGQVNAVYPNGDGARTFATSTARYAEWLWRYYASTGDLATVTALYSSVARAADWLWSARQAGTGLLYGLADTSNGDPVYGYDLSVVADTASNVLAVNAFDRVAQLAAVVGDPAGEQSGRSRAGQLAAAINAALRRPDGTYVDGIEASGAPSSHASQEANALALAYGVVPANDVAVVGAYVASLGIDVGPNHALELLRALAAAGMPEAMVHTLTDTSMPGWAHIVQAGGTFTWEVWKPSDLIGDSMSHGWGSSALVAMQETLLGVALQAQGPDGTVHATVRPPRSGLDRAAGSVPTVAGPLQVSWQRRGTGMALAVTVPANATALVSVPAAAASGVRESGHAVERVSGVTSVTPDNGYIAVGVGSGTYRFTST